MWVTTWSECDRLASSMSSNDKNKKCFKFRHRNLPVYLDALRQVIFDVIQLVVYFHFLPWLYNSLLLGMFIYSSESESTYFLPNTTRFISEHIVFESLFF